MTTALLAAARPGDGGPRSREPAGPTVHRDPSRSALFWVGYLALGLVAIAGYYAQRRGGVAQAVLLTTINGTAAAFTLRATIRSHGRTRVVWAAMSTAMMLTTVANGIYYSVPLVTGTPLPFPNPMDLLFLGTYACYVVALGALAGHRRRADRRGDALDASILAIAAGSLMWEFIIGPIVHSPGLPLLAHTVAISYPAMDLVVFALLIRLVVATSWPSGALRLLLASVVLLLASDALYATQLAGGTYAFGGPTDALWMASYLLIGVSAVHPSARSFLHRSVKSSELLSKGRLAFLGAAVLTGPALLLTHRHEDGFVAGASALTFLLVMARLTGLNRSLVAASVELESRASTDSLTGLANRAAFYAHLETVLARPARHSRGQHAVLFVDLDDFKDVNDELGHAAGDALLLIVADRLRVAVRPHELVARLGGDEFALLLHDVDADTALGIAERALTLLAKPADITGVRVHVGASIGLARRRAQSDPNGLMREADIAMYAAKRAGKNCVEVYDAALDTLVTNQYLLKAELFDVVARGELVIEYQPVVELLTAKMVGVEALVRWQHPSMGLLEPSAFIGLAEQSGAIVPIGEWVLETACRQVRIWQQRHALTDFDLSVNVSMRQLEPDFAERVIDVIRRTDFEPRRLVLELTESVLIDPRGHAAASLATLRELGVRIAVDDFGTGFASISYLCHLPIDILKVDRSFVSNSGPGPQGEALLDAIVGLGHRLGLEVIPEGIEQVEQLSRLQALGCRTGQGFLLSRPMPPNGIATLLRHNAHVPSPRAVLSRVPVAARSLAASS